MVEQILDSREIIQNIDEALEKLVFSTNCMNACLVTEDGLLIINKSVETTESTEPLKSSDYNDQNNNLASISASLLSIVESIINVFKDNCSLSQFVIHTDTSPEEKREGSYIIVKKIVHNVFLAVNIPKCTENGLIYFEIEKSAHILKEIIQQQDKLFYSYMQNELGTMI